MNQMYQDPWFDPNSPNATWGRGAASVMQGLYGQMMQKQQTDEAKRQFDLTHGLAERQQGWEETNTPAYQFGQMTDITRDKWGGDVPLDDVQENYFRQFTPKYDQTIAEKVKEAVESGAFPSAREAYEYFGKVGSYDPYQVRVQGGYGGRAENPTTKQWNDTLAMWRNGDFGDPADPLSQEKMLQYWKQVGTRTTENITKKPQAGEHALLVKQASTAIGSRLAEIKANLDEVSKRYGPTDKYPEGIPKTNDGQKVGGVMGLFQKDAPEWSPYHRQQHDEYLRQQQGFEAALTFAEYVWGLARSGKELPESVVLWFDRIINFPDAAIKDPAFFQQIPMLEQEIQASEQQQQGVSMGDLSSRFSAAQQQGGLWR